MIKIHNGDNWKDDALSCMQCSQHSGDDFILHALLLLIRERFSLVYCDESKSQGIC